MRSGEETLVFPAGEIASFGKKVWFLSLALNLPIAT